MLTLEMNAYLKRTTNYKMQSLCQITRFIEYANLLRLCKLRYQMHYLSGPQN